MSLSILVVDDEPLTRNLLRLMLEPAGYRVSGAADGFDALEKAKELHPDIMLLDVMMPAMDGITVCKKLRGETDTADLPIVMLSGKVHREAIQEGLEAGANRYLSKPMSRMGLLQELRDVLNETVVNSKKATHFQGDPL
ncbi:MAG: response regulator [Chloroflexi bacterium]|nr:response regulator [Chloroflexota bacterium]